MTALECYFVRHGETDYNRQRRCQGLIDIPLNELGKQQARAAAEKLRNAAVSAVYSSPLTRAVENARIVAEPHGLSVETLDWLTEIDHGELEGKNEAEADAVRPGLFALWHECPAGVRFPGGEALEDVARRAGPGLAALAKTFPVRTIVLVTHQVLIGTLRCLIDNRPLDEMWADKLLNGEILRRAVDAEAAERLINAGCRV